MPSAVDCQRIIQPRSFGRWPGAQLVPELITMPAYLRGKPTRAARVDPLSFLVVTRI
jgi:hypothetical protein